MTGPVTPLTTEQFEKTEANAEHPGYVHRVLKEIDETANVALGGQMDESISSREARAAVEDLGIAKDVGEAISSALDVFQADHGAKAEVADLTQAEEAAATELASPTVQKSE